MSKLLHVISEGTGTQKWDVSNWETHTKTISVLETNQKVFFFQKKCILIYTSQVWHPAYQIA